MNADRQGPGDSDWERGAKLAGLIVSITAILAWFGISNFEELTEALNGTAPSPSATPSMTFAPVVPVQTPEQTPMTQEPSDHAVCRQSLTAKTESLKAANVSIESIPEAPSPESIARGFGGAADALRSGAHKLDRMADEANDTSVEIAIENVSIDLFAYANGLDSFSDVTTRVDTSGISDQLQASTEELRRACGFIN